MSNLANIADLTFDIRQEVAFCKCHWQLRECKWVPLGAAGCVLELPLAELQNLNLDLSPVGVFGGSSTILSG